MRVLLIDVCCKIGSTGKIVYDLYSHINQQGNEAAVCYGRGKKIKEKNIYKFGFDWETFIHAFLTRITGYTGCFSFFSTRRLIKFIKKFNPDVVHIHELHAYFVNISMLLNFLKKRRIKIVHTLHCAFSYTGKCGHHLDCENWKKSCGNCPRLREYVSTLFFDKTKKMFLKKKKAFSGFHDMTIVTPSKWLADLAKESFLGSYPIRVVHNGINTTIFRKQNADNIKNELYLEKKEKVILSVAPNIMSDAKGGKYILELANLLKNMKYKFILIGDDNKENKLYSNVIILNRITDQKLLAKYYSTADLFVICSKMENFPTTCLESQCCGTPICGFDVGGVRETDVLKREDAFVNYGDIESLSKYIISSKSVDRERIIELAQKEYSIETFANEYIKIYRGE